MVYFREKAWKCCKHEEVNAIYPANSQYHRRRQIEDAGYSHDELQAQDEANETVGKQNHRAAEIEPQDTPNGLVLGYMCLGRLLGD